MSTRFGFVRSDALASIKITEELELRLTCHFQRDERSEAGAGVLRNQLLVQYDGIVTTLVEHREQDVLARTTAEVEHHATTWLEHLFGAFQERIIEAKSQGVPVCLVVATGFVVVSPVVAVTVVEVRLRYLRDAGDDAVDTAGCRNGIVRHEIPRTLQHVDCVSGTERGQVGDRQLGTPGIEVAADDRGVGEPVLHQGQVKAGAAADFPDALTIEGHLFDAAQEGEAPLVRLEGPAGDVEVQAIRVGREVGGQQGGEGKGDAGMHGNSTGVMTVLRKTKGFLSQTYSNKKPCVLQVLLFSSLSIPVGLVPPY